MAILLGDCDIHTRSTFITPKSAIQSQSTLFTPMINPKSKQIAESRLANVQLPIYEHLYTQGVKDLHRKEY